MFSEKIKKLSLKEKTILTGSVLVALGSFLPWFYVWPGGTSGPSTVNGLHGLGLLAFLVGMFALVYFLLPLLGQKQPKLEISPDRFYYFCGLLIIVATLFNLLTYQNIGVSFGGFVVLIGGLLLAFPDKILKVRK